MISTLPAVSVPATAAGMPGADGTSWVVIVSVPSTVRSGSLVPSPTWKDTTMSPTKPAAGVTLMVEPVRVGPERTPVAPAVTRTRPTVSPRPMGSELPTSTSARTATPGRELVRWASTITGRGLRDPVTRTVITAAPVRPCPSTTVTGTEYSVPRTVPCLTETVSSAPVMATVRSDAPLGPVTDPSR